MADIEVVRETCMSKDGTQVPMTSSSGAAKLDGSRPAYLMLGGGLGAVSRPRMHADTALAGRWWRRRGGKPAPRGERDEEWEGAGL